MLNVHNARFVKSAAAKQDFLFDGKPLILLAGRSNVGKSSVINSLLNRKNFARVGASPGKTTQINYFCIDEAVYLVDLPGYGYAKRSFSERDRWAALIDDFFVHCARNVLANAFGLLIIDARHGPQDADFTMANYFASARIPFVVVANKCDKLNKRACEEQLREITRAFAGREEILLYSAEKGTGRAELLDRINSFAERNLSQNN